MAQTKARMDEYMLYASTAETVGVPYDMADPDQIKERWPLIRTDDLKGAIYHPTDGYINPADVTQAMAKGARQRGVRLSARWQVDCYSMDRHAWDVTCTKMVEKGGNLVAVDEQVVITPNMSSPPPATTRSARRRSWASRSRRSRLSTSSSSWIRTRRW